MRTKRSREAYLLIDHRNSPGITPEFLHKNNLSGPAVGSGQSFESAMFNCCGCGADVILNPDRSRAREWCFACDKYMCDSCALNRKLGKSHVPLQQFLAETYDKLQK